MYAGSLALVLKSIEPPETATAPPTVSPPDTETSPSNTALPTTVAVPPTCKLPPTVALLTEMLPSIDTVIPVKLEPSP